MSNHNVVHNGPSFSKGIVEQGNEVMDDELESVGEDFGNDLIGHVAKAFRPVIFAALLFALGNKNNIKLI